MNLSFEPISQWKTLGTFNDLETLKKVYPRNSTEHWKCKAQKKTTPRKQNPMAESLLNKADSFSFTEQTES